MQLHQLLYVSIYLANDLGDDFEGKVLLPTGQQKPKMPKGR